MTIARQRLWGRVDISPERDGCRVLHGVQGGTTEKGTLIGLCVAVVGVLGSAVLHGINVVFLFTELGSILIVFSGCIGANMISFPMEATSNASKYVQKVMKGDEYESAMDTITQIVKLTNRARSGGLLALEEEAKVDRRPVLPQGDRVRG